MVRSPIKHTCSFQIDYKGKGYFSGKPHSFKAALTHNGRSVNSFEGQWTGVSHVGSSKGAVFLDTSAPKEEVTVAPVEQQGEWESRKLWASVANGIRTGNYDAAGKDKSRLEVSLSSLAYHCIADKQNEQRQRRKDEQAAGTEWKCVRFEHTQEDVEYQRLVEMLHDKYQPAHEDGYVFKG